MKSGKRALALLMALLMFMCGCIVHVNAASSYETGTVQSEQTPESAKTAKSASDKTEAQSETVPKDQTETSEASSEKKESRSSSEETQKDTTEEQSESTGSAGIENAQTESVQTESETEQETAKVSKSAEGAFINSPNDPQLISLIPDENFRKVIYDSLASYTQYGDKENGWLGGDPDNPPETVQEILETYQGPIDGAKSIFDPDEEKIKSIEGIQYLKIAGTADRSYSINLSGNLITDLMPIAEACNNEDYYYGGYVYCQDYKRYGYRAVVMEFLDNPLRCIPKKLEERKLGFLVFTDLTRGDMQYVKDEDLQFYYLREDDERFDGYLRVGFCQYESMDEDAEYVPITGFRIEGQAKSNPKLLSSKKAATIVNTDVTVEQSDQGPNKNRDVDAKFQNLTKSCNLSIYVQLSYCIESMSTNFSGNNSPSVTSIVYMMRPQFTVFDRVKVSGDFSGSVRLQKVDEATGQALKGAVFSLYKESGDGDDLLIKEGLVTDKSGYTEIVSDLEPGTYYFLETKAPEGYHLSTEKHMVTVEAVSPSISGGLKNLDYSSANGDKIQATAEEDETYTTWKMENPVEFHLKRGEEEISDADAKKLVSGVEITYHSLEGSSEPVKETYKSLEEAQTKLNSYIEGNSITGAVEAKVIYAEDAKVLTQCVTVGDKSTYATVTVDKKWVGSGTEDILPEVTFHLYQATSENGEKKLVNSYTVPEGTDKENYSHTFETDSEGNKLPMYYADSNGNPVKYVYTIEEEFESNVFEGGEPGEPITEIIYDTLPSGEKVEVGTKITIPVTNYKAVASIKIIKIDAKETDKKLSDVEFKLEMQEDGQWKEVAIGITDERGEVQFEDLDSGEYRVTETKTQEGYILLKEPLMISIGNLTDPDAERDFVYVVENTKMYELPQAGGFGSRWYVWVGIIVLAAAGIIQIQKKKLSKK